MEGPSIKTSVLAPPESRLIDLVLVLVRAESDVELSSRISSVLALPGPDYDHPKIIADVVVFTLGGGPRAQRSPQQRPQLVDTLLDRFGPNISVLHGSSQALVGLVGSFQRMTYLVRIPQLSSLLERVRRLEPGQVLQFD